jgi:hypothetical protein
MSGNEVLLGDSQPSPDEQVGDSIDADLDRLAGRLYWELTTLDPHEGDCEWKGLTEAQREIYRLSVRGLFEELDGRCVERLLAQRDLL